MFQKPKKFDWNEWAKIKREVTGKEEPLNKEIESEMKASFLYFDHNNLCRIVKKKIKNGEVDIEDKRFHVDVSKPLLWRKDSFFGLLHGHFEPLFIIKWDEVYPEKTVNPVQPSYMKDDRVNPEMLKKTMSLKIIGNMLKSPKEINWFVIAIFAAVFGAFVMYYLFAMKAIRI
jgi:hypothetical protein